MLSVSLGILSVVINCAFSQLPLVVKHHLTCNTNNCGTFRNRYNLQVINLTANDSLEV